MINKVFNILVVDDEEDYRETLKYLFESEGYMAKTAASAEEALTMMMAEYFPIVVTDIMMEGTDGIEFLQKIKSQFHDEVEVIMVTGYGSIETAVETMKKGAFGYFIKSSDPEDLLKEIKKATAAVSATKEQYYKDESEGGALVTSQNPAMQAVWDMVAKVADSNASVLITGESGTGKEIVANRLHRLSSRKNLPFIAINCQSYPSNLIESELFGHEKGAFTGAIDKRIGKLEQCGGGTIFFDEIGDMSLDTQTKLLRVIETKKIERLGSNKMINVDFRAVFATNKDIYQEVRSKLFREDFLYRINTIEIKIPPLRERREDIPAFVDFFVHKYSAETGRGITGIDDMTKSYLKDYDYPGNIRELKNIIERLVILAKQDGVISLDTEGMSSQAVTPEGANRSVEPYKQAKMEFEKKYIMDVLAVTGGNITQAAEKMGISRRQLFNKIKELGIE